MNLRSVLIFLAANISLILQSAPVPEPPMQIGRSLRERAADIGIVLPRTRTGNDRIEVEVMGSDIQHLAECAVYGQRPPFEAPLARPKEIQNFGSLSWRRFQPKIEINLGREEGERRIWFGFRLRNGEIFFNRKRIFIDRTAPKVTITAPKPGMIAQETIHLQGWSDEGLAAISYQALSPEGNILQAGPGTIARRHLAPDGSSVSRCDFACNDISLAAGQNKLLLKALDLAGNESVTPFEYTVNFESDKRAPQIVVHWPQTLDEVFSDVIRLRGEVDENSSTIIAYDAFNRGCKGIVERDGHFWIYGLTLKPGANTLHIDATDPAGNTASTSLTVLRSPVTIAIAEPPDHEKAKSLMKITGSISHEGYAVWVNGVRANAFRKYMVKQC